MKRRMKQIIAFLLAVSLLGACAAPGQEKEETAPMESTGPAEPVLTQQEEEQEEQTPVSALPSDYAGERPLLVTSAAEDEASVVPCVEAYEIKPDLSNTENLWQFAYLSDEITEKLGQNGFVVCGYAGREFFEVYEMNRYDMIPNFVTVDSLMHTYHLYFSYLLKNIEKEYLTDTITQLSLQMLDSSKEQYDRLRGTEWEEAARRNVAFFTIGAKLLDESTVVDDDVKEIVEWELAHIDQADNVYMSEVSQVMEDYTQYIPRGYYDGDERLEQYFRAMMWYGRIHFSQDNGDMDRSALLISKALADNAETYKLWESVYAVTSFFAGTSDDIGVCEYIPAVFEAYGSDAALEDLIGNQDAFMRFRQITATLTPPQINSIPIQDGEDNVIPGFRFMGQRFTIDAAIMQKLIYSNVEENSKGDKRMLPDVLDVPAALGSETALDILTEKGEADYADYMENMNRLREGLSAADASLWSASLYANWLNTLRPLLIPKGEGYPIFMQSEEWTKKNLECFAGSFTELKHDTILYSKQVIAEMGGGYDEEPDDRGYVEPEPLVYARFSNLARLTAQGLKEYGMLAPLDEENLRRLQQMADQLLTISKKELVDEVLTPDEYEFIKSYGGSIEHFWYEVVKEESNDGVSTQECPAAVVVDVATDPNGAVLEMATDDPSMILVVVKVDGKIKIAKGSVYSFYQFTWPMDDRLTDEKWRQMIGDLPDEDGNYNYDIPVEKPEWTHSYRYIHE